MVSHLLLLTQHKTGLGAERVLKGNRGNNIFTRITDVTSSSFLNPELAVTAPGVLLPGH